MDRIDRFEVESVLGTGAFATVWLARDPVLDLRVAIKVLADNWSRDPGIRARFIDEARVLWQADSNRIVRVHHVGELDDGRPFFVMGWADRGNLRDRMTERFQSGAVFSTAETASITAELCRAVGDVHSLGRIHRDIKPANVLLRSTSSRRNRSITGLGADEQLVLADFGLAREIEASAATLVSGSPAYVAPEQAGGVERLDERADIYPLGLIMVELLTGSSPAVRATMLDAATTPRLDVANHLARAGVTVPVRLLQLAELMVEPDPANRPSAAADLAAELAALVAAPAGSATPTALVPPLSGTGAVAPQGAQQPTAQPSTARPSAAQPSGVPVTSGPGPVAPPPVAPGAPAQPDWQPPATPSDRAATSPLAPLSTSVDPNAGQAAAPAGYRSVEPASPGEGSVDGGSRLPLLLLGGAAAVVALAVIAALALTSGSGGESTTSTQATGGGLTTSPPAETDQVVDTQTPTSAPAPPPADGELPELPLPDFASLEPGSDDTRAVANVASSIDEVRTFYETLAGADWQHVGTTETADGAEIELASTYREATVILSPAAVTAGSGITRIEVRYRDR